MPLIVDNTVATPYLIRPLEWGADVVVHSTTKYLGGHGTAIGGAIIDAGRFDYAADPERFPQFNEPDPSYHGLRYAPDLGVGSALGANLAFILKARVQLLRDLGPAASPFNSFLLAQGIETLSLRMERHVANATRVAEWLSGRDEVESVAYAGLPTSKWYELGQKYAPKGAGAVLAFEIAGGLEAGKRFVNALELHSHVANIGDVRSLVIHPASTTHSQLQRGGAAFDRRDAGPGPAGRRDREHRRHPGRSGRRVPGRQGGLIPAWQPGDPVGDRRFADLGALPLEWSTTVWADGALPGVRLAYETWGELSPAGDNAVLVLHALTGDSHVVGEAGPGHPTPGWWGHLIGPGQALDTDTLVRRGAQHPRRLPGLDRSGVGGPGRGAVGIAVPAADHPRPGDRRDRPGRPARAGPLGAGAGWVGRWDAGGRVGGHRAGAGRAVDAAGHHCRGVGRPDRLVPRAAAGDHRRPGVGRR